MVVKVQSPSQPGNVFELFIHLERKYKGLRCVQMHLDVDVYPFVFCDVYQSCLFVL
ncbi:hypothetical protein Scep_007313 [Stephania cephalantha]|uniref:Uncharacterized protein n=1 Tax=Stephania cephalantha TaxID=152367 RepID=A0AAP0PPX1_9MAGN